MSFAMVWMHCSACGKQTVGDTQFLGKPTSPNCCGKGVWVLGRRADELKLLVEGMRGDEYHAKTKGEEGLV